jgi:Porin PorA
MRRVAGYVCMFLGALMLMVGVLAKPVLYHNLAKVPLDQKITLVSIGDHMSALQASKEGVKVLTDVTLQNTRVVVGIPAKAKGNSAFWQYIVTSKQVGGNDLDYSQEGVSFDRVTGEATNCCGDYKSVGTVDNPSAIKKDFTHKGLFFKFPFNTQKTTYQWWDGDLGRTVPIKFVGTQQIQGVQTYVFRQKIGPETYAKQTALPGSLFNTTKPVDADAVYENTRTLYVEPNTGVVIKGVEEQNKRLEAPGFAAVPITKGTIGYDAATVKKNVTDWGSKGKMLGILNGPLTWIGILLGLLLIGAGAFLEFGRRRPRHRRAGLRSPSTRPGPAGSSQRAAFSHRKIAVPGMRAPRSGLHPPQTCWFSCCHSGSTRSTRPRPAAVSSRTRSPSVRWCST